MKLKPQQILDLFDLCCEINNNIKSFWTAGIIPDGHHIALKARKSRKKISGKYRVVVSVDGYTLVKDPANPRICARNNPEALRLIKFLAAHYSPGKGKGSHTKPVTKKWKIIAIKPRPKKGS